MAVAAAEQQTFQPDYTEMHEASRRPSFGSADKIPGIHEAREEARREATAILTRNRTKLIEGDIEDVPVPVDALGTAKRAVAYKEMGRHGQFDFSQARHSLIFDCKRLFAEARRKNSWEYFPEQLQERDYKTGEYIAYGYSIQKTVEGGLSPMSEPEEQDARIGEYVEEATYKAIGRIATGRTVSVKTISRCPDWALEAFQKGSKQSYGGYVPEIDKLIIRNVRFISDGRYQEQMALPGLHITDEVIHAVLTDRGGLEPEKRFNKTELRGTQFVDLSGDGVIEFTQALDAKASKQSRKNIYLGEEVPADFHKDYSIQSLHNQAIRRSMEHEEKYIELADYLIELAENHTDEWAAEGLVDAFVKEALLGIAKQDPKQAEAMFDKATADGFVEVRRLEELGFYEQASRLQTAVEQAAPAVSYCGAGSCGLESVRQLSEAADKAKQLGLDGTKLLHDTVRSCKECRQMTVHYDITGNKACIGCGFKQVNGRMSKPKHKKESKPSNKEKTHTPVRQPQATVHNLQQFRREKAASVSSPEANPKTQQHLGKLSVVT